ncbi:MAG: S41 family peptidase [Tissierellia bacterium]|nr:S41 family peptidase [Tissierellia bacterium]
MIIFNQFSTNIYLEEFEYVYGFIRDAYSGFYILDNEDWLRNKNRYKKMIKSCHNDTDYMNTMDLILKEIGDGHVNIVKRDSIINGVLGILPDGFKKDDWDEWLKKDPSSEKVLRDYNISYTDVREASFNSLKYQDVHNLETKRIIDGKVGYIKINSMLEPDPSDMNFRKDQLRMEKFIEDEYETIIIDLRSNAGGSAFYWLDFLLPYLGIQEGTSLNWISFWTDRGSEVPSSYPLYDDSVKIYEIDNSSKEMIYKEFPDLRGSKLEETIFNHFSRYSKHRFAISHRENTYFNQRAYNLYFLTGPRTGSASDALIKFVKVNQLGKIVGERTKGDPVPYKPTVPMPYTGMQVGIPLRLSLPIGMPIEEFYYTDPDIFASDDIEETRRLSDGSLFKFDEALIKVLENEGYWYH